MTWLRRMLVPYELSPSADAALRYAGFLSECFGAGFDVLYAVDPEPEQSRDISATREYLLRRRRQVRRAICRVLRVKSARMRLRVVLGGAERCIERAVAGRSYDLVVVGSTSELLPLCRRVCEREALEHELSCGLVPVRQDVKIPTLLPYRPVNLGEAVTAARRPLARVQKQRGPRPDRHGQKPAAVASSEAVGR